MNKRLVVLSIIILIILAVGLIFLFFRARITGNVITGDVIQDNFSFTKAICQDNYCQDYEIVCINKTLISLKPLTEMARFPDSWQDPRTSEDRDKLCE